MPGKRSAKRLTLGNLLDGFGYASEGVLEHGKDGGYTIDIAGEDYEAKAVVEFPDFDGTQQRLRAKVCLVREGCDVLEVTCQQRYEANKAEIAELGLGGRKPKLSSDVILRMLLDRGSRVRLTDFNVTCPDDPTEELISADDCEESDPVPATGGLYDPKIFGERKDVLSGRTQKWGYIELPVAIPLRGTKNRWVKIVPVLPLCYRATMGIKDPSPIDRAYQEVLRACKKVNEASVPDRGTARPS